MVDLARDTDTPMRENTYCARHRETIQKTPLKKWSNIALRVKEDVSTDHIALVAAGIAFYGLLAVFPAITALMAITGLIYEPSELVAALEGLTAIVPPDVSQMLLEQARDVAGSQQGGLTLGLIIGVTLALWSASAGLSALIEGINLAYDETETRGFVRLKLLTLGLTLAMILGVIVAGGLAVGLPIALNFLAFAPWIEIVIRIAAYVPLAAIVLLGLAIIYRYGPDRDAAHWHWLTPGAAVAVALWLLASLGFTLYVQNFASYNETFGSIAGVIVLLMWMWISAFVILLGAELNAEIEAQTHQDIAGGQVRQMGQRGAVKSEELGEAY
ncbi:MAG: YihY/virulence factor BrkB family protein [Pseudomonadota bacterium]